VARWTGASRTGVLDPGLVRLVALSPADRRRELRGTTVPVRRPPVPDLVDTVLAGAVPDHGFHEYPWLRLLDDDRAGTHALTALDRCRLRWRQLVSVHGDRAAVRSRAPRFLRHDTLRRLDVVNHRVTVSWPATVLA
jgi:hypothetical protein